MKFFDIFKKLFAALSNAITGIIGKLNKAISDSSGKPKMGHSNFKKFGAVAMVAFVLSMLIYNWTRPDGKDFKSVDAYKKELAESDGVRPRKIELDTDRIGVSGTEFDSYGNPILKDKIQTSFVQKDEDKVMEKEDCLSLMERVSKDEELTLQDREKVVQCADENPMGWDQTRLEAARQSVNENLSEADKKAAREAVAGKKPERGTLIDASRRLIEEKPAAKESLGKAGINLSDVELQALAKKIKDLDKTQQDAVKKAVSSSAPVVVSKADIEKIKKDVVKSIQAEQGADSEEARKEINKDSIADNKRAIREAADELIDLKDKIKNAEDDLRDKQVAAKEAAKNAAKGKELTDEEAETLAEVGRLTKEVKKLRQQKEDKSRNFAELKKELDELMGSVNVIEEEVIVGGYVDEKKLKSNKEGNANVKDAKSIVVEPPPSLEDRILNTDELGPKRIAKTDKMKFTAEQAFISLNAKDDKISISPASKFLAIIGKMEVTSNQLGQQVRGVLISNIYDSKTGKIIAPKRSILIGKAPSFNDETGKMDLVFTQVIVGSRRIDVNLRVGSADGSMGLNGDIYDTRKRKLVAAWIGSFMNGVTGWFSEAILRDYENTKDTQKALIGAALGGLKDVSEKQTQMIMNDLQNAPTIFSLPDNTPVVLYPE